jgi:hypothetical protein
MCQACGVTGVEVGGLSGLAGGAMVWGKAVRGATRAWDPGIAGRGMTPARGLCGGAAEPLRDSGRSQPGRGRCLVAGGRCGDLGLD